MKAIVNYLRASETHFDLEASSISKRLRIVLYLISLGLIYACPTYPFLKITLFILVTVYILLAKPDELRHISRIRGKWSCEYRNGVVCNYDTLNILIHNELIQLIQVQQPRQKKHLVLFTDQLSNDQLRILHVMARSKEWR